MHEEQKVAETENYVYDILKAENSGHDWWHIYRVKEMAGKLAKEEGADFFVCIMAALLHDLADEKVMGDEQKGMLMVKEWLCRIEVDRKTADHILEIIATLSFKGGGGPPMKTIEGKVVQDADRLDALGAIGIARAFAFSGAKGQVIHRPDKAPNLDMSQEEYRKRDTTAINHFYEKLLRLKDLMNTEKGKELAVSRHDFMMDYLSVFFNEWEGK